MVILAMRYDLPLVISDSYDLDKYLENVAASENRRCEKCFELRLGKTAAEAEKRGFGYITTTLLISPHQKHDSIKKIGQKVADEAEINFLYADLRKRYSQSRHITKPMELYRQKYCGCVYSWWQSFFERRRVKHIKA